MKRQKTLTVLSWLIAALALLAAGAGVLTSLLWFTNKKLWKPYKEHA